MSFWSVPKQWGGETCAILAGGPSLRAFDSSVLQNAVHVITINDSWRLAPWADVHYFCDRKWWDAQYRKHGTQMEQCGSVDIRYPQGIWIQGVQSDKEMASHPSVHHLRLTGQRGFDPNPGCLRHGCNSGYQAIHLAAHFGVKRILLLGYDMQTEPQRTHWHMEERPQGFAHIIRRSFLPHFPSLAEELKPQGIEVLNCTPDSALQCWPYQSLEEALSGVSFAA